MKASGDHIHARGLKFGIYQAPREETCAQYFNALGGATGALNHEQQDADTFAAWGVDFLKYDWCSPWGNDITSMSADVRSALTNPDVLAINQDSAGRQAQRVSCSVRTSRTPPRPCGRW